MPCVAMQAARFCVLAGVCACACVCVWVCVGVCMCACGLTQLGIEEAEDDAPTSQSKKQRPPLYTAREHHGFSLPRTPISVVGMTGAVNGGPPQRQPWTDSAPRMAVFCAFLACFARLISSGAESVQTGGPPFTAPVIPNAVFGVLGVDFSCF